MSRKHDWSKIDLKKDMRKLLIRNLVLSNMSTYILNVHIAAEHGDLQFNFFWVLSSSSTALINTLRGRDTHTVMRC